MIKYTRLIEEENEQSKRKKSCDNIIIKYNNLWDL